MSSKYPGLTNEELKAMWKDAMTVRYPSTYDQTTYGGSGIMTVGGHTVPYTSSSGVYLGGHTHGMSGCEPQAAAFDPLDMLRMRLGVRPCHSLPFQYIQVFKASNDKYIIFVVQKDAGVILEDAELFPSDKLITQLRLIAE
jgi:hypothetical protein